MEIDAAQWPAFSLLMDQMLDLPPAERAAWVAGLTGEAAALAPQLLSMLQAGEDTRTTAWLDTLPKLPDEALRTLMESGTGYEQAGEEVGPYRLVRLLGRGGMGSVWYAERSDRLVRRGVALKLPQGGSPQMAARFERERDIVAGLVHPHIARLYDAGVASSGQAYLALEYVEGEPLDQYCDARRMGVRARIALFSQVLSAVQYAHSRLVIHRDIKPSNILVNKEGEVRLLDFGVAKMLEAGVPEASDLTRMSNAGMTLAYASPEQVAGRPVTTATDIYSLGIVLFELLVGVRPYRLKRDSRGALEDAILQAEIPLASATLGTRGKPEEIAAARGAAVKRLRKELQGDIDAILIKALSRTPQERYETAASFAEDLERHCNGHVVRAHRRSRWYQTRKFIARNQIAVAASFAMVAALTAAAGIALWQAREAQRQAEIAALERDRALAAVEHREAVDEFMQDLLMEAGRTGKPISISSLVERANTLSASEFAENPDARATVLRTVAQFDMELEGIRKAAADFELAEKLLANSRDAALRASVVCDAALIRGVSGQTDGVSRTLLEMANDPGVPPFERSECLVDLTQFAISQSDRTLATRASEQAMEQWRASARHSPYRYLQVIMYRAEAQALNGQPGKADAGYLTVMTELKKLGRERGELAFYARLHRFDAAISSGDLRTALAMSDEALQFGREDFPDREPGAFTAYERGVVLADLGRYADALAFFESAVKSGSASDPRIAHLALFDSAAMLSKLGRTAEAEARYRKAVDFGSREPTGPQSTVAVSQLLTRAKLDLDGRRFRVAKANLEQAAGLAVSASYTLAALHRFLAMAELGLGDADEALRDARLALSMSETLRGDKTESAWVGLAQVVLGQILEARGDVPGAKDAYAAAIAQLQATVLENHPELMQARRRLQALEGHRA